VIDPVSRAKHTAAAFLAGIGSPQKLPHGLRVPLRHPLPPPLLPKCLKETERALVPAEGFFLVERLFALLYSGQGNEKN